MSHRQRNRVASVSWVEYTISTSHRMFGVPTKGDWHVYVDGFLLLECLASKARQQICNHVNNTMPFYPSFYPNTTSSMADSPTTSFSGLRRSKSESAAPSQRSCPSSLSSQKPTASDLALPPFSHSQTSIILRPFYLSDTPIIHQYLTDETIRLHVASPDVPTAPYELLDTYAWVLNAAQRFRKLPNIASNHEASEDSSTRFHLAIVRTEPNTAIGCISLDMYIGNGSRGEVCEIGYWLGKEWRGKGIMTTVVRRVVAWVFQEWSSVIRIDAGVYCS